MLSRKAAHSADNGTPRGDTSCSLPNQRSAAAVLARWLARVLATTPRAAWCSWLTAKRTEVKRAGMVSRGRSSHLPIWRSEQTQWRFFSFDRSLACSIAAMASTKLGSRMTLLRGMGITVSATLMEQVFPKCKVKLFRQSSTV